MGVLYQLGSCLSSGDERHFFGKDFLEAGDGGSPVLDSLLSLSLKECNGVLKAVDEGIGVVVIHVGILSGNGWAVKLSDRNSVEIFSRIHQGWLHRNVTLANFR